jgi:hypothetical protein
MVRRRHTARALFLVLALLSWRGSATGQELEPRAFSAAPTGTSFLLAGIGKSAGAYVLDPSVPIGDVEADVAFATVGGGYTFGLLGRQARVLAVFPVASGDISGDVGEQTETHPLRGLVDPRFKFSIGLIGVPALTVEEFARAPRQTAVGASLTVMPPIGQYDPEHIVNLGYNRWAFKPEIGVSHPIGRWTLEGSAGVWLFTTNHEYHPGNLERTQDPIVALQGHVGYTFESGAWLAFDGTWFAGGQTEVNGIANSDRQNNTRFGLTLSLPLIDRHSVKLTYSSGTWTQRGSDFDTISLVWQVVMF